MSLRCNCFVVLFKPSISLLICCLNHLVMIENITIEVILKSPTIIVDLYISVFLPFSLLTFALYTLGLCYLTLFFFLVLRAALAAYGSSWARGPIRAAAASLRYRCQIQAVSVTYTTGSLTY